MSNYCHKNSSQAGFSIIEVLVAFVVLTVGLVGIAGSFPYGLKINKESENTTSLVYLSQAKLEEILSLPYTNVATGTIEARHFITTDPMSGYYRFESQTVAEFVDSNFLSTTTDLGLKKVTVTIYYHDGVSRESKSFTNNILIAKH